MGEVVTLSSNKSEDVQISGDRIKDPVGRWPRPLHNVEQSVVLSLDAYVRDIVSIVYLLSVFLLVAVAVPAKGAHASSKGSFVTTNGLVSIDERVYHRYTWIRSTLELAYS